MGNQYNNPPIYCSTHFAHWFEALHGLAGKLSSDGMEREGSTEEDEG